MTHFRICSFKANSDKPLSYKKIGDILNLQAEIRRIAEKTDADYVSLRIIRTPEPTPRPLFVYKGHEKKE